MSPTQILSLSLYNSAPTCRPAKTPATVISSSNVNTSPDYPPPCSFDIGRCTTGTTNSSSSNGDEDWLVVEILTRLRVKSLFRFKSVCKRWCSLIQNDQNFIYLHLTRSKTRHYPRIFIVVPLPRTEEQEERRMQGGTYFDPWPYEEFHITADLLFEETTTTTTTTA